MINVQRSLGERLDGRGGLPPHGRQEFPAQPAAGQRVRPPDRRASESGARHAERRLPDQRADDGVQRAADVACGGALPTTWAWGSTTPTAAAMPSRAARSRRTSSTATTSSRRTSSTRSSTAIRSRRKRDTGSRWTRSIRFPGFSSGKGWLSQVVGGWQLSGIVFARTGVPLRVTQPSGIANSRPDLIGDHPVLENYRDTLFYLDRSQFALVPTSPVTQATLRPGTANPGADPRPGKLDGEPVTDQRLHRDQDRAAGPAPRRVQCVQPRELQQSEHEHRLAGFRQDSRLGDRAHGADWRQTELLRKIIRR